MKGFISNGSYGSVYVCSYNNNKYALKSHNDSKSLKYEANIYKELRSVKNISSLIDCFLFNNKYYLVLELYSLNLQDFKTRFMNSEKYKREISNYNTQSNRYVERYS